MSNVIGKMLSNRYEIKEQLGSGGMSIVYKGLDTALNRVVTIKVLREQYASDENFVRRFRREAQSVASLSHANIVSIFDVGSEGDLHYLVMGYIDGQNLKEYIRKRGKLTVEEALPIAMQILKALEHAHDQGVIHRDIKPHNILLTKDGQVKVTDFGIARAASETTVTYTGTIVGSVHYISPEQAKGSIIGAKSDIYAAGVVLYEMVTGQLPFTGESPISIALQHIQNEPVPPNKIKDVSIPKELSHIILKAMQKNPDSRYNSACEMYKELEKLHLGKPHEVNMVQKLEVVSKQQPEESEHEKTTVINLVGADVNMEKEKTQHKRKPKWVPWVIGLVILLGLTGVGYMALMNFLQVEETSVPNVEGMALKQAEMELREASLIYNIERRSHNTIKKDFVISQSIQAGRVVKKNRSILLIVSDGPILIEVPNLKGKSRREVEVELSNSRLQATFVEDFNNKVPAGEVVSQQPIARMEVPEDSTVTVVISLGPEPKYITMPGLINLTFEDAKKELTEKKLKVGSVTQKESTEFFPNQVMSQDYEEGALVLQGTAINLVISEGPGPVAKMARVTYEIPDDKQEHRLQIVVTDEQGVHQEFDRVQQPGEVIVQDVPFYGEGKIQVYLDGQLVYGQDVP